MSQPETPFQCPGESHPISRAVHLARLAGFYPACLNCPSRDDVSLVSERKSRQFEEVRRRLDEDMPFRRFFEQETTEIPAFFVERIKRDLGPLWDWLPEGAIYHDAYAYLKSEGVVEPSIIEPGIIEPV